MPFVSSMYYATLEVHPHLVISHAACFCDSAANEICYPTEGENSTTEQYGVVSEIVCKHARVMEIGRTFKLSDELGLRGTKWEN